MLKGVVANVLCERKRQVLLKRPCQCARRLRRAKAAKKDRVQGDCGKAGAARSDRMREACKGVREKSEKAKATISDRLREACEGVREKGCEKDGC